MVRPPPSRAIAVSESTFRRLLLAYPRSHRNEYGEDMAQVFRDQCRDAWTESKTFGLAKLWLRVLPDVINTSLWERLSNLNPRKTIMSKLADLFRINSTATVVTFGTVFMIVFLATVLLATAITFILPESYASTARVKVERDISDNIPARGTNVASAPTDYDPYFIQTEFEVIQSELVLSNVISRLNLNVIWGKKYFAGETLKTTESMELLKGRINLMPVRNTKLISITVYSDDKNEAARLANAIAESYRDYREALATGLRKKAVDVLSEAYQQEENEIQAARTQPDADKLAQLQDMHKLLFAKLEAAKLETRLPHGQLVQIVDTAEPGRAPVKPNKPLNIVLGAIFGAVLGTIAGTLAVLGTSLLRRSRPKPAV